MKKSVLLQLDSITGSRNESLKMARKISKNSCVSMDEAAKQALSIMKDASTSGVLDDEDRVAVRKYGGNEGRRGLIRDGQEDEDAADEDAEDDMELAVNRGVEEMAGNAINREIPLAPNRVILPPQNWLQLDEEQF